MTRFARLTLMLIVLAMAAGCGVIAHPWAPCMAWITFGLCLTARRAAETPMPSPIVVPATVVPATVVPEEKEKP